MVSAVPRMISPDAGVFVSPQHRYEGRVKDSDYIDDGSNHDSGGRTILRLHYDLQESAQVDVRKQHFANDVRECGHVHNHSGSREEWCEHLIGHRTFCRDEHQSAEQHDGCRSQGGTSSITLEHDFLLAV